ncbi:MAG: sigma-54-dependent Fis family transcriptional regulator [Candidatus Binatia bacterium]
MAEPLTEGTRKIADDGIHLAWRRFIDTGEVDATVIRPEVAESWRRSRAAGVDPFLCPFPSRFDGGEREARRRSCEDLLLAADPILRGLHKAISPFEMAIVLTARDGFVLRAVAEGPIAQIMAAANLSEGESLAEHDVGTTSAAIVAHTGRPIQLSGAEHYCRICHGVTCAAAPVVGADGEVLGIVNITASHEAFSSYPYALGMAVAAAEAIGHNLRVVTESRNASLSDRYLRYAINQIPQGLILIDASRRIRHVNEEAQRILGHKPRLGDEFVDALGTFHCLDETTRARLRTICLCETAVSNEELVVNGRQARQVLFLSVTPIHLEDGALLGRVIEIRRSREYVRMAHRLTKAEAHFTFDDILGESPAIRRAKSLALRVAEGDCIVLLEGESGTGKELFAHAIHLASARVDGPFVAINCAAFPQELIESELFGYEDGAFTGARRGGRMGKIELAEGGTLFLDEIGEMPLGVQAKLLRFLEEKRVLRLGGNRYFPVNVRIMAATNQDLLSAMQRGSFRQDLYYRVNVVGIHIPPLREHIEDVPLLASFFLEKLQNSMDHRNGERVRTITQAGMEYLMRQPWSGNVRELRNWIERALYTVKSPVLSYQDCLRVGQAGALEEAPGEIAPPRREAETSVEEHSASLRELERDAILNALRSSRGNVTRAARTLGISRPTIYEKMRRYGIGDRNAFL